MTLLQVLHHTHSMAQSSTNHPPEDPQPSWTFNDYLLGEQIGLKRDGGLLEIEPKALQVLIHLVRHHHRVVSREELLDAIWTDEVVEEAVLSQIIFKLRKVLGDSARNSRFIATRHRRGYQFVAPVNTPSDVAAEPHRRSGQRRFRVLLVTLMVVTAGLMLALWRTHSNAPAEPLPTLGFMPIVTETEDSAAILLGQMFDDLLFSRLSDQPGLITRSRTIGSLQTEPLPEDVEVYARQQQVDWVLRGQLVEELIAGRVWLDMELIRIGESSNQNFPLDRYELPLPGEDASIEALLAARNRVAEDIGQYIGIAILRSSQSRHDPSSLESLRLFLLGLEDLSRLSCGGQLAVQYLRQAVEIDPQFTYAWVALGYAWFNEVWACGGDVQYLEQAYTMVQKALQLEPGNTQALPLEVQLLASLGRAEEALLKLLPAVREQPDSAILNFYASLLFNYAGNLEASETHLSAALQLDPFLLGTDVSDPPMLFLYQGDWQGFVDHQAAIDSSYHRFYRGYALWQLGDRDQATAVLRSFEASDWQQDPFAAYGQALLAILERQPERAAERARFTHQRRHANGIRDGEMTFKEAWLMALAGQPELALRYLSASVDEGFACNACIRNSPFGALPEDLPAYRNLIERIAEREQRLALAVQQQGAGTLVME